MTSRAGQNQKQSFFFFIRIHSIQGLQPLLDISRYGVTKLEDTRQIIKDQIIRLRRRQRCKIFVNISFELSKIICQRKTISRQRIPNLRSSRKETIRIDPLVCPRNRYSKIVKPLRISSSSISRMRQRDQISKLRGTLTMIIPVEKA